MKEYVALNLEQIKSIPELRTQGKTHREIAAIFGCSIYTINRWVHRLKERGYPVPEVKPGRKPII